MPNLMQSKAPVMPATTRMIQTGLDKQVRPETQIKIFIKHVKKDNLHCLPILIVQQIQINGYMTT